MTESCRAIHLPPLHTLLPAVDHRTDRHHHHHFYSSSSTATTPSKEHEPIRKFSPVILFHDDSNTAAAAAAAASASVFGPTRFRNNNPYCHLVQLRKNQINEMLESNGKLWTDMSRKNLDSRDNTFVDIQTRQETPFTSTAHRAFHSFSMPLTPPSQDSLRFKSGYFSTADVPADDSSCSSDDQRSTVGCVGGGGGGSYRALDFRQEAYEAIHRSSNYSSNSSSAAAAAARKRRGNLPKPVTAIMKRWLVEHCINPYPTEDEKNWLQHETGLTLNQISNWFINARRRILPMILLKAAEEGGKPIEHHRKRRGKPPSSIAATRRKMAKRSHQKFQDEESPAWNASSIRSCKRSSDDDFSHESPHAIKTRRI